eukprot:365166-Chlamydomonas_euryale.AAC.3
MAGGARNGHISWPCAPVTVGPSTQQGCVPHSCAAACSAPPAPPAPARNASTPNASWQPRSCASANADGDGASSNISALSQPASPAGRQWRQSRQHGCVAKFWKRKKGERKRDWVGWLGSLPSSKKERGTGFEVGEEGREVGWKGTGGGRENENSICASSVA